MSEVEDDTEFEQMPWEQKATIWLVTVELALEGDAYNFSDLNERLAKTMKKACAMQLLARAACKECDWPFDKSLTDISKMVEEHQVEP